MPQQTPELISLSRSIQEISRLCAEYGARAPTFVGLRVDDFEKRARNPQTSYTTANSRNWMFARSAFWKRAKPENIRGSNHDTQLEQQFNATAAGGENSIASLLPI